MAASTSTGLPTCPIAKIQTASNAHALSACRDALVGQRPVLRHDHRFPARPPTRSKGASWSSTASKANKHVLFGHIFSPTPFATSFVITFEIKNGGHGTYGTVLTANLKKALGTKRNLTGIEMTLDRRYTYRGTHRSYVSAGCPAPKGVSVVPYQLARTTFTFANGWTLSRPSTAHAGRGGEEGPPPAALLRSPAGAALLLICLGLGACGGSSGQASTASTTAPSARGAQDHGSTAQRLARGEAKTSARSSGQKTPAKRRSWRRRLRPGRRRQQHPRLRLRRLRLPEGRSGTALAGYLLAREARTGEAPAPHGRGGARPAGGPRRSLGRKGRATCVRSYRAALQIQPLRELRRRPDRPPRRLPRQGRQRASPSSTAPTASSS